MSYATDHPVFCVKKDEGCTASYPGSKHHAMRAVSEGWFVSKAEEVSYCPAHVPDWVPEWRARQAARRHKVEGAVTAQPPVLKCSGCKLEKTAPGTSEEEMRSLAAEAFEHGKQAGHVVQVTTVRALTVRPVSA